MDYLFYDLETSGLSKEFDQIFQFAAIRTDSELNVIGEPIELFCKLRPDLLPSPHAIRVNQVDVRELNAKGLREFEFAKRVEETLLGNGNQCIVGYNSSSFDDELIRYLLYRNLLPPYDWTWRAGNSCLDLYSVVCLAYSFNRMDKLKVNDGLGADSLKLENLAKYNELIHEQSHDAVSDVRATIQLARLIRETSPKLFDHALGLRDRDKVRKIVSGEGIFCHSCSTNGYEKRFLSLHRNICDHPTITNSVIAWNLSCEPASVLNLSADEIRDRKYAKGGDRTINIGFEEFKTNKRPMVVPYWAEVASIATDYELCTSNLRLVCADLSRLADLAKAVFTSEIPTRELDADLYVGFFEDADVDQNQLRICRIDPSMFDHMKFQTQRFKRQLRRLKARNFPEALSPADRDASEEWLQTKLNTRETDRWLCWDAFKEELQEAFEFEGLTERQAHCLTTLRECIAERDGQRVQM
jgi:exodeoxyribonuclease-1